jgi:uncharacterized RDD family membrane protein YckC
MPDQPVIILSRPVQPDWADAWAHPEFYQGVATKRVIAYVLDALTVLALAAVVWFAGLLLGLLSFGLLLPLQALAVALVPLAYHTVLIAGPRSATLGMRAMNLRVMSVAPDAAALGGRPTLFQAMIQTVAFYGSLALTGTLVLVVALFNPRRRLLHDWLAGTVVVNVRSSGYRAA